MDTILGSIVDTLQMTYMMVQTERESSLFLTSHNFCISSTLILKPGNNNLCDSLQLSKLFVELEAKDVWYMARLVAKNGQHSRHVL
jgi:hypothetical protein